MKDLDAELRRMLGRREPPPGFTERVLRRSEWVPGAVTTRRSLLVRWAAAAALVAAVAGGLEYRARRQEQAAGQAAKEQVIQALQIARNKLQLVQAKIHQLHEPSRSP
jgi:hypothetical protein